MAKKKKSKGTSRRNFVAVAAFQRSAGAFTDRKKKASKRACRGKVREE